MDEKTREVIEMILDVEEMFLISNTDACERLGTNRVTYRNWIKRGYTVSNKVYNKIKSNYEYIKMSKNERNRIDKLQNKLDALQEELNSLKGL